MKVIFLDIDGVLSSTSFQENNKLKPIDRKNVALLKELAEKTKAVIVLSSGWKLWFDNNMKPQTKESAYLYDVLCQYGIILYEKTPDYSTEEIRKNQAFSQVRAKEIKAWLNSHKDIESYIVLDDLDLKDEDLREKTVRVNNSTGLSEEDIDRAVQMFGTKSHG